MSEERAKPKTTAEPFSSNHEVIEAENFLYTNGCPHVNGGTLTDRIKAYANRRNRVETLDRAVADATMEGDKHRAEIKRLSDHSTKLANDLRRLTDSRDRWRKVATSMGNAINRIVGEE